MKHRAFLKSFFLLMALAAFCTLMHTGYVRGASQERYTYTVKDGTAVIVKVTSASGQITLPTTLGGYPVSTVGDHAFANNEAITGVTIPRDIHSLVYCSFLSCLNLKTVTLPDTLRSIGTDAFALCESLEYNIIGNARYLGNPDHPDLALMGPASDAVTTVTVGKNTTVVYDSAFLHSPNLKRILVDKDNPYYLGDAAGALLDQDGSCLLQLPQALSGCYTVPETVKELRDTAFLGCASLNVIIFPGDAPAIVNADAQEEAVLLPDVPVTIYYPAGNATWTTEIKNKIANQATWIAAKPYEISEGADPVVSSAAQPVSIRLDGNAADFTGMYLSDAQVPADACAVTSDNGIRVTFTADYLSTLSAGRYRLYLLLTDGYAETTLTVVSDASGDPDGVPGLNVDDAIYLLQHVLMPDLFPVACNADYDKNGTVNVDDAIYLLQHVLMPDLFPI